MQILLLGPVRMRTGGRELSVGPAQLRLLLAVLALEVNRVVPMGRLVDLLWPVSPPRTAVHAIQVSLSRLRRVLAQAQDPGIQVVRHGAGYLLQTDPDTIDAHRFATLAERARREDDERRVALLDEALGLWSGPAMSATAASDDIRHLLCQELEEARLAASEDRIDARLRLGRHREVLGELTTLVGTNPLRERLVGQQMLALYRCGRPADALEAYRLLRKRLADELGLDPGAELRQLEIAILRGDPVLNPPPGPASAAAVRRVYAVPAQLPPAMSGFAGRTAELDRLDRLLAEHQADRAATLITAVHGTAGVGKTALALHWAHQIADQFPDGQLYVNLCGFDPTRTVIDPADALRNFLHALDVPPQRIPTTLDAQSALYRSLVAGKRILVLLDNAHDTDQVRPLLPGAPGCLVLVTSRNQLPTLIAAHRAHPLTLDLLSHGEARQLLIDRVGASRVAADPQAADAIITACGRLPLALAIVAARAAIHPGFGLHVLATELHEAHNLLDALAGGDSATDIRAVFSWSYQQLGPAAARLFRLLSLHPGPDISTSAAASLADQPLPAVRTLLAELARAHLIDEHIPGRYALHDLLRAYATEQANYLDSEQDRLTATRRILDHYLHTAYTAHRLLGPNRDPITLKPPSSGVSPEHFADNWQALAWIRAEHLVLTATINHAAANHLDTHVWQLVWALAEPLGRHGHWHRSAAIRHSTIQAAHRLADPRVEGTVHCLLGNADLRQGRLDDARTHLQHALGLFQSLGDLIGQARIHRYLAELQARQGHSARAFHNIQQALDLYSTAGHRSGQARTLTIAAWLHTLLGGDHQQALICGQKSLDLFREADNRHGQAYAWETTAYAHQRLGRQVESTSCHQHAQRIYQEIGRYVEADILIRVGDTHQAFGDADAAQHAWQRALTILDDLNHTGAQHVRDKLGAIELDRNVQSSHQGSAQLKDHSQR